MTSLQTNESRSIFDHIKELRKKLFFVIIFFLLGTGITHIFNSKIISFLLKPAGDQHLIFLSPLEPLFFIFKIDFIGGIIISFPILVGCIFLYISPALSKKINHVLIIFYIISIFLLFLGLIYAFFVTIPFSLKFLFSIVIPGIDNNFSAEQYINFFISQTIIIISVFQIPIIIISGIYLKFIKTKIIANKRRFIYLVLLVLLATITPTTDIFSLGIIFIPCIVIFEISLIGGKIIEAIEKNKK